MVYECSTFSFAELLSNIVDNRGKTCPIDEEGLPLIATNCVKNDTLHPVFEKVRYVNQETYETWFRGHPEPGDLIFVCKGAPGNVCWTPDPVDFCIAQDMVAIRANRDIVDPKFLFALLRSQKTQADILNMHVGTMIPHFKKGDFKNLYFEIPNDKNVQKTIGEIYFSFSEKIELNHQMNATLEALAQALFKSWFVDFDPVIDNAFAAGNPIPEPLHARAETRSTLGNQRKPLPEAIQKQFPNSFVFSEEMGWIPEGWEVLPVSQAIDINPRVALRKGQKAKYVDMKALPTSGYTIDEVVEKAYSGGAKFCNGDTLLARITPCLENGKTGVVDFLEESEPGFGSTEFIVLRTKGVIGTPFIATLARDDNFRKHCVTNMVGSSGRQRVQNACFDSYYVCTPGSIVIMREFHGACAPMFEKMTALKNKTRTIAILRDTLLPKLLSGQLRIPDAEKLVAEAV